MVANNQSVGTEGVASMIVWTEKLEIRKVGAKAWVRDGLMPCLLDGGVRGVLWMVLNVEEKAWVMSFRWGVNRGKMSLGHGDASRERSE